MAHCDVCALLFTRQHAARAHEAAVAAHHGRDDALARHHRRIRRLEARSRRAQLRGGSVWSRTWTIVKNSSRLLAAAGVFIVSALAGFTFTRFVKMQAAECARLVAAVKANVTGSEGLDSVAAIRKILFDPFSISIPVPFRVRHIVNGTTTLASHFRPNVPEVFTGEEGLDALRGLWHKQPGVYRDYRSLAQQAGISRKKLMEVDALLKMSPGGEAEWELLHSDVVNAHVQAARDAKIEALERQAAEAPASNILMQVLSGAVLTMGWTVGSAAFTEVVEWLLKLSRMHYAKAPPHVKSRISYLRFAMRFVGGALGLGLSWLLIPSLATVASATTILVVGTVMAAAELWRMTTELRTRTDLGKKITLAWLLGVQ